MEYFWVSMTSFILCSAAIFLVKPLAVKAGLVDLPTKRKQHNGAVPLVGGVAIYIAILLSSIIFVESSLTFNFYLISSGFLLLMGVLDDRFDLSVKVRLLVQIGIACLMIFGAGFYLDNLGNIFGYGSVHLGYFGVFVTIVAIIGAINAFNMIDGIDGLAGVLSLIAFLSLAGLFAVVNSNWYVLPVLFVAATLAFLMFNLRWPFRLVNKIFMGDAGSMLIGFTIVCLLVIGTDDSVQAIKPVTALYLIAIPLMDMVAIMYRRIKKGSSPFKADREHLHHIFERAGYSRKRALVYISLSALVIALLGCIMQFLYVPEWIMFIIFILIFLAYNYALIHVWKLLSWLRRNK